MSIKTRPAETAGAAVGTGGIIAAAFAGDWLAAALAAIGYIPALVTFIVVHGGIRGCLSALWKGVKP